jgi:hypothetical protein
MTTNPPILRFLDSPHDLAGAEEAGATAYRAGVPRDPVPSLCGCAAAGVSRPECGELVRSWCRGWEQTHLLQQVSERMFPVSAALPGEAA